MGALFEMYPGLDSSTSTMKTSLPYGKLLTVDNQKLTVTTNIFRNQSELARVGHHKVWRVRVRPSFTTSIVELEAHD